MVISQNGGSMTGLVSVVVPVYKVKKYLERCVQSIVAQSYENIEIILVDDESPDSCPVMCDQWAERDPRIQVIHKKKEDYLTQEMRAYRLPRVNT